MIRFFCTFALCPEKQYVFLSLSYELPLSCTVLHVDICTTTTSIWGLPAHTNPCLYPSPMLHLFKKYIGNQSMWGAQYAVENIRTIFQNELVLHILTNLYQRFHLHELPETVHFKHLHGLYHTTMEYCIVTELRISMKCLCGTCPT